MHFSLCLRCLGMWQWEWWQVPAKMCAGAVLALAVLDVFLLAEGDGQRGESSIMKELKTVECSVVLQTPCLSLRKSFYHLCFINCKKYLVISCIVTFVQPCLFIPTTPWSRCSVWFCILHHNKSSVSVGWAVVPQLVVVIIIPRRRHHRWTLPGFYISALRIHSYNLNSFACYCN